VILVDTSAIYALANPNEPNHQRAQFLFERALSNGENLLLHSYIISEATALLQNRLGLQAALKFLDEAKGFEIHWVDPKIIVELRSTWRSEANGDSAWSIA
jgi:predicted nucleic acid-binding protein